MTQLLTDKPTRHRYVVMVMIFICVVITYMDRANISVTAPSMQKDLGLSNELLGWIFSGFAWTYAFCQIPGGWLVDRVPPRVLYPVCDWSAVFSPCWRFGFWSARWKHPPT